VAEAATEMKSTTGTERIGRIEMTGTVLAVADVKGRYKLVIRLDDGSKVWGRRFANLCEGDRVRFTADVSVSKRDPTFGFYKRPVAWMSPE
jgi:hypothetical protein